MGLTKQYRRFVPCATFGAIGSIKGGIGRVPGKPDLVITSRAEDGIIWNIQTGEKVLELKGEKHEVTCLKVHQSTKGHKIAAMGYQDGAIRLFDTKTGECMITFHGHKSAVTSLGFDDNGLRLASGSNDCNVIVWDIVNESGLYKLKGHKGPITNCAFMKKRNVLITSSRDTLIKFWDLNIQHCFNTLAAHLREVWDFALIKNDSYLVTTSSDPELRIWRLTFPEEEIDLKMQKEIEPNLKKLKVTNDENGDEDDEDLLLDNIGQNLIRVEKLGTILKTGESKRTSNLEVDPSGRLLMSFSGDNAVEPFLICNEEEVKKRCQKRAKRERRKIAKNSNKTEIDIAIGEIPEPTLQEEFRRLKVFRSAGKVKYVTACEDRGNITLYLLAMNNLVEKFVATTLEEKDSETKLVKSLSQSGHRSDVRTVAFSSDNTALVTGSHESVKIWSRATQVCLRTVSSGYCLSSLFAPGDRQVIIGTKKGSIQIIDINSAEVLEEIEEAHAKEIFSLSMNADKKGFVSASADQTVKFWTFELISNQEEEEEERLKRPNNLSHRRLSIVHQRTLKLDEDALAVKQSEDGRLIAVSLMDSTVKVFFVDSLKFFLSLYGHKLPVLALDMSSDSRLIATGSADKNVKIWGLDFGDCHKSIFAHEGNVTSVKFIPNTHMFFTAGKDGKVKQWDADSFERIITLDGHFGEIWSMAVSPNGKFVVSTSHDKTIRLWERSEEVLVLDDERETEREQDAQDELATGDERVVPGQEDKEAHLPTVKTAESEKGAERLMEAIALYKDYEKEVEELKIEAKANNRSVDNISFPPLPPLMAAYQTKNADEFMAKIIGLIKASEIEQTLLVFPFDMVINLLSVMEKLLSKRLGVEVVGRMFFFLVEIHFGPLSMAKDHFPLLRRVRLLLDDRLKEMKDLVGFNNAALNFRMNAMTERQRALELMETVTKVKEKRRKKKSKQKALQTAIMSL